MIEITKTHHLQYLIFVNINQVRLSSDQSGVVLPTCHDNNFPDQFIFRRKNFLITTRD
jgi:hypothetical protein